MRLGVNGRFLGQPPRGVQRVAREITARLVSWAADDPGGSTEGLEIVLLLPRGTAPPDSLPAGVEVATGRLAGQPWEHLELPGLARRLGCDLVLGLANGGPTYGPPSLTLVHDVLPLSNPEWFTWGFVAWYRHVVARAVRRARLVLVPSRWTASQVTAQLGVPEERIRLVTQGLRPFTSPAPPPAVEAARARFALEGDYVLAVGGGDPRKSVPFLEEVLERWHRRRSGRLRLVTVGGPLPRIHPRRPRWPGRTGSGEGRGAGSPAVGPISRAPKSNAPVSYLGDVTDQELHALYTGAVALCFPSRAEGFGRPPLEALACGTAALVGRYATAAEVLDGAATVLPLEPEAWADALERLVSRAGARGQPRGLPEALRARYSWSLAARQVLRACFEAAGSEDPEGAVRRLVPTRPGKPSTPPTVRSRRVAQQRAARDVGVSVDPAVAADPSDEAPVRRGHGGAPRVAVSGEGAPDRSPLESPPEPTTRRTGPVFERTAGVRYGRDAGAEGASRSGTQRQTDATRPRRIAMIVPGGVDRSGTRRVIPCVLWLLERLVRAVDDVQVFALWQEPRPSTWKLLGATVHNVGFGGSRTRAVAAIVRQHRRAPFDLLHALWVEPSGVVAAAAGALIRRPVLVHVFGGELAALHDLGYGGRRTARGRLAVRLGLSGAARVVAQSEGLCRMVEALGFRAGLLPTGVDTTAWPPASPRPRPPGRPLRLLHVGSLNPVKDQTTLLAAAAELDRRGVPFVLDVVGEDTMDGRVQRLAGSLGLADRTRFHGFLPHPELRPLFDEADLLVVSSRHEAGPLVVREAAVAGVPTVGTSVGWIAEWAPEAAVAVPVADAAGLANALQELGDDDRRRLGVACAAQARALREDADWSARAVLDCYAALSGASPRA